MSLHHLRIFLAVYTELSITKAANKLYISQPAISKYIREIETFYGHRLFERSARTLTATPFGEDLYHYAAQVISLYDEMNQNMGTSAWREKSLRIGVATVIGELTMPSLVKQYSLEHPEISISVFVGNTEQMAALLINNSLDFVISEDLMDTPLIENTVIHQERLVAICNTSNPLAQKELVTAKDLAEHPLLLGRVTGPLIEAYFASHLIAVTPLWQSTSVFALINAVKEGIGISFQCLHHVLSLNVPQITILNVPDLMITHNTCVHHKKTKKLSPAMQTFIHSFCSYITQLYEREHFV